nr:730_t:CDS:2 [Entrophospora candida]
MEEEWIIEHEKQLMERECLAVLTEEGKSPKPNEHLKQLLKNIDEKEKVLKYEQKSGKVNPRKGQTSEKLWIQIENLTEHIKITKLLKQDKEDNKTIALGTSKIHYIDPRISVAWCKKYNVPIAKIFNKNLKVFMKNSNGH